MSIQLISWNIDHRIEPWRVLTCMDADVALLQEAGQPPSDVSKSIDVDCAPWSAPGVIKRPWRTAVARLSQRVEVEWIEAKSLKSAESGEFGVSRLGTLAAAHVSAPGIASFVAVSVYSLWTNPHACARPLGIVSDASAHRVVSDLSAFTMSQDGHRVLVAGDLNILHGYGEHGDHYWASRYGTVFDRMEALGLRFVGPQYPQGRQATPRPKELPCESKDIPTYYWNNTPGAAGATRQLDFDFASRGMADSLRARAINEPEQWGPSDHCRLEIDIA